MDGGLTAPPTKQQRKANNRDPLKTRVISVAALSPMCHPSLVLLVYCTLCSFQELQRAFTQAMMGIGYWILVGTGCWLGDFGWLVETLDDSIKAGLPWLKSFLVYPKNHIISCNKSLSWRLARTCCNDYRYIRRVSSFFISGRLHDKSINNRLLSRRIFIPTGPKKTAKAISETRMGRYHSLTVFACGYTCCYTVLLNMRGIDIQVLVFLG